MMNAVSEQRPLLTVVSNADEGFFPGLAVALTSALAAASGKYDYQFLVLDGGISPESMAALAGRITSIAGHKGMRATLDALTIDQNRLSALPERRGSRMTYAKLVLPEILPNLDSVIYMDADVLCYVGVEAVHAPVGQGHWLLAGAQDYFAVIEKDCPWIEQVPTYERTLPYINCGIMGMNLKGLREIDFTSRAIHARAAILNARQGDQSVFNFLCRGRSYILPENINHRTSIGASRPLCEGDLNLNLHFIGAPKPWSGGPKTSNWLAHCLWHQANAALFPASKMEMPVLPTYDQSTIRNKSLLYAFSNPQRAAHYRSDLRSLKDPGKVLAKADKHWKKVVTELHPF